MQEVWLEFPTEICDFLNVFPRQEKPDRQVGGIVEGKGSGAAGGTASTDAKHKRQINYC